MENSNKNLDAEKGRDFKIFAIDFDDTICAGGWPDIEQGTLIDGAKETINSLIDQGDQVIIWTCRTNNKNEGKNYLYDATDFLEMHDINYTKVNNNSDDISFDTEPKVYADVYIDDKQFGGMPNWKQLYNLYVRNVDERKPTVWFTSDTHFGSQRTLGFSKRPFNSVSEMDRVMVNNWNRLVRDNDIVVHLGDFGDYEKLLELNGNITLLLGNYEREDIEKKFSDDYPMFVEYLSNIDSSVQLVVGPSDIEVVIDDSGNKKILSIYHEPIEINEDSDNFNLFGHIHKLQMIKKNALNVGTDCHNFCPINIDDILFYENAILNHYDENVFC